MLCCFLAKNIKTQQTMDYSMAAIPGWAYLGSGILIAVLSKIVEKNSKPGSFALFFWIGIIFIAVGVGKIVFKYVFRKEKKAPQNPYASQASHAARQHSVVQHQRQAVHHQGAAQAPHLNNYPQQSQQTPMHHLQGQHSISKATSQQVRMQESSIIVPCPACGTRHYDYANFCMRCGTKIKR
jgi:hypothetical protein